MTRALLLLLVAACSGSIQTTEPKADGGVSADAGADVAPDAEPETGSTCEPDAPVSLVGYDPPSPDAGGPVRAKIHYVNTVAAFPSIRLCFATGLADDGSDAQVAPLPPLPYDDVQPYPRILPSTVYTAPSLTDMSSIAVTVYAVDAAKVSNDRKGQTFRRCDAIISQLPASDFRRIAVFPRGTFARDKTFAAVLRDDKGETHELTKQGLEPTGMQVWNLSSSPADVKIGCTTIASGVAPGARSPMVAFGERGGRLAVNARAAVPLKDALVNQLIEGRGHTVVVFDQNAAVIGNDPILPKFD